MLRSKLDTTFSIKCWVSRANAIAICMPNDTYYVVTRLILKAHAVLFS